MLEKYRAIIHGDTIEWEGDGPNDLSNDDGLKVEVTVISDRKRWPKSDGKGMADALAQIAARGGVTSIPDPVAWQREIRKDHPSSGEEVIASDQKLNEPNGKKLVAILQKIADRGGIPSIKDPVKWQRKIRKDRPLPGRE